MSELGQLLKQSRMEKGISLDDLQETTKIQKRYLLAIEEGNYKILPGSFYVRAFIKSYAEAVGLEPGEVLHMYQNVIPSPRPEHAIEPIRKKRSSARNTDRWNKWISGIVLWLFIILIAGLIYYFLYNYYGLRPPNEQILDNDDPRVTDQVGMGEEPGTTIPDGQSPVSPPGTEPPVTEPPPDETEPDLEPIVKLAKSESGLDYYDVEYAEHIVLELTVVGDACWIQVVELDGPNRVKLEEGTINHGDIRTYEVGNSVYLNIGRASALDIKVNGESIPRGEAPNPKKFQFDLKRETVRSD